MNNLCIVIRKAPYGTLAAAEGVRHLIGAVQAGMAVCAVLVDDGVYLARRDQDPGDTGWTSLSRALEQTLNADTAGTSTRARVYLHRPSVETRDLDRCGLIPGTEFVDDVQLAAAFASADGVLVF
jgi:sulfur relay (sulfurtransferase) DsrF/TusC family protein